MGIQGLLPLLKSIQKACNLGKFAGQTIGVDAYGWLHRGTVACAIELALDRPTAKFVDFAMHRVRMLQHFGVIPFLVFDGDYLPSKAATELERSKKRKESKKLGLELLKAGKTSQAYLELQKAIDVTPEMARLLIEELKKTGVQYIVAPYEADAQMVYLERKGVISAIISEDSDLLVFGAKRLLTKLDQYGNCIEVRKADFCACREINLTGWSDMEFRQMAILSGCDYLASINNMGLKTAYRMIRKYKTIEKVIQMLQFDGKYHVPKGYLEAFYQAELTFLYQRVYCPLSDSLVFHTQPDKPIDEGEMPFIGAYVEPAVARKVATGELNPMTKEPIFVNQASAAPLTARKSSKPQFHNAVATGDLKKGVSIEEYFKPKRIPLGEMDPNCFTPPSNQNSYSPRNSARWPDELPRPYIYRTDTEQEHQSPQSAPNNSRDSIGRRISWTTSISEPRPPKRARLCADYGLNDTLNQYDKVLLEQSRFFSSSTPDPSPLVGRSTKAKRSKKEDSIAIYSDDSIEEALLSLPDCDGWQEVKPKDVKKIHIFNEAVESQCEPPLSSAVQIELQNGDKKSGSQTSTPNLTQLTSDANSIDTPIPITPVESCLSTSLAGLKEKFAFSPPVSCQKSHALPTPPSSTKPSRIPLPVKPLPLSAKQNTRTLTPLQRLGIKALSRYHPQTPPSTPTACKATSKRLPAYPMPKNIVGSILLPKVTSQSSIELPVSEPAGIPLPQLDGKQIIPFVLDVNASSLSVHSLGEATGKGSEDLIIHDSEEHDEVDSLAGSSGEVPKVD